MSVNSSQRLDYRRAVRKLEALLPEINRLRSLAETHEELAAIEGSFLQWFKDRLDGDLNALDLRPGYRPSYEDLRLHQDNWSTLYRFISIDLDELIQRFLQYENAKQLELLSFESHIKRLLQKRAATRLWQGHDPRAVLSTSFQTYDGLSPRNLTAAELSYEFEQGVATLPVVDEKRVRINGARILQGSNGQPGNSNIRVSQTDNNPLFALNDNPGDWFEYERLDNGPVTLVLALDMNSPAIVNKLELEMVEDSDLNSVVIDGIEFVTPNGSVDISELTGPRPAESWRLSSFASSNFVSLVFLPVEVSSVIIKISAHNFIEIETAAQVFRKRFSLGFKNISLKTVTYDARGSVASSVQSTAGASVALPIIDVWPVDPVLYKLGYEYSLNQSGRWHPSDLNFQNRSEQSSILLDGNETGFEWRLTVDRNDLAFANVSRYSQADTVVPELGILLTSVSRFASPASVVLRERPKDNQVFVLQPQLLQVTDDTPARYVLGVTTGKVQKLKLPVNVFNMYSFVDDVEEFNVGLTALIGGELVAVTEINDSPAPNSVSVASDGEHLVVNYSAVGLEVVLAFPGEKMVFEQKPDGFYHKTRALLDPDKDRIRVFRDPLAPVAGGKLLVAGRKFIKLDHQNIDYDSIEIVDTATGTPWGTKKDTYAGLTAPDDYYVDLKKGILFLHTALTAAQKYRIKYIANSLEEVPKDEFDIYVEAGKPVGVRISNDAFKARSVTEGLDGSSRPSPGVVKDIARREIRTGEVVEISDTVGAPGYRLTYDSVVPGSLKVESGPLLSTGLTPIEIPFIDGVSEFTGLTQSDSEVTVYLEADSTGRVSFSLAARNLWERKWGIAFGDTSVFKREQAGTPAVGDYVVDDDGLVTLNVGVGGHLEPGISINYFYTNPDFNPQDKFSVNYSFGSIHSSVGFNTSARISYKVARYKIWYDVAQEVPEFSYNASTKIVSVKTENLRDSNNLLRVLWVKSTGEPTLERFSSFFSPLIYQLGHVLQ